MSQKTGQLIISNFVRFTCLHQLEVMVFLSRINILMDGMSRAAMAFWRSVLTSANERCKSFSSVL